MKRLMLSLLVLVASTLLLAQTVIASETSINGGDLVYKPPTGFVYLVNKDTVLRTIPTWSASNTRAQDLSAYDFSNFGCTMLARINPKNLLKPESLTGAITYLLKELWNNEHGWSVNTKAFTGAQTRDGAIAGGGLLSLDFHPPRFGNISGFIAIGPQLVAGRATAVVGGIGVLYSSKR